MATSDTHQAIEAVFRIERARLIGGLARMVRDVGTAEDLAQDALAAALAEWPRTGVPRNPGAWLMAAAKRRAIDGFRRDRMRALKHAEIGRELEEGDAGTEGIEAALDDDVGDELLSLIFVACHPTLSREARAALTLRLIGGLTTDEIARAFLAGEATIAQRIVRAKKTLREAGLAFEVPRGAERAARLGSVLEVIYLIFNEGYAATAGEDLIRPALCAEAQRLGRILAGLMPDEPEVWGLLALMEIQASRLGARIGRGRRGDPADRAEPRPLGPAADPPRPRGARAGRAARRGARALCAAGGARRLPCPGAAGRGHRLGADRGALRHARARWRRRRWSS